jgi:hypothetical protein
MPVIPERRISWENLVRPYIKTKYKNKGVKV